jgi:hypothetical protein
MPDFAVDNTKANCKRHVAATFLAVGVFAGGTASAGSHSPAEAAFDDAMSGCIRIVADGIPPVRALPGATEEGGKWTLATEAATITFDAGEHACYINLPSMDYDREAALKSVRDEMLGANVTDLQDRDLGRIMPGVMGDLNGKWVHIGVGPLDGAGSQFVVKAQR